MDNPEQNTTKNQTQNSTQNPTQNFEKSLHEKFVFYGKNVREWTRKCTLLLPEIEKREIWKKHGFANIYEYARILAGMSTNAVSAALWTMRKTENKPELRQIIEEKGISAVRPIANLATPETDKFWAEKAREMSGHTLETYALAARQKPLLHHKFKV
ncbi:MAG: hypothetical protein UT33_C0015G0028 [Candidatus Peregrinibacteria bacterium GW2011_GWC2_39_14]|nr:MAG: hypothetical protein UT33_C0015G0028 [Candidatus Peregrinibacteria bacterium GW2011_GWC2_39_14]